MLRFLMLLVLVDLAMAQTVETSGHPWAGRQVGPADLKDSPKAYAAEQAMKSIVAFIKKADEAVLFEGLPHQTRQKGLLSDEIARKRNVVLFGFHFYLPAQKLPEDKRRELAEFIEQPGWFRPQPVQIQGSVRGRKGCGAFHPDFQVEWKFKDEVLQMQLCFGCADIIVIDGKQRIIGEFSMNPRFTLWFQQFNKLRPPNRVWSFQNEDVAKRQLSELTGLLKHAAKADVDMWEHFPLGQPAVSRPVQTPASSSVSMHGYSFLNSPTKLTVQQRDAFLGLVLKEGTLRAAQRTESGGYRRPGGDYLLRFAFEGGTLDIQVALNRGELHYYWNDDYGYAPLSKEALEEVKKVLAEFRKQRPERGAVKDAAAEPAK